MRTTIVATLLALGTLAILAPSAAAEATDVREISPLCVTVEIQESSRTIGVGPVEVTLALRYAHIVTACVP